MKVLQDIKYGFDLVGNVSGYRNEAGGYRTEQRYGYDGLYQGRKTLRVGSEYSLVTAEPPGGRRLQIKLQKMFKEPSHLRLV
ncbi:MAG: hypothetical protein LBH26_00350 [Treponema sp.]|jgi:hypothetical protein|nr:hypothetical protein [Treponema sp.]